MSQDEREQRREKFLALISSEDRTRAESVQFAAGLLSVSIHTVNAWLKPESSKSSNEIPVMAIELLELKLKAKRAAARKRKAAREAAQ